MFDGVFCLCVGSGLIGSRACKGSFFNGVSQGLCCRLYRNSTAAMNSHLAAARLGLGRFREVFVVPRAYSARKVELVAVTCVQWHGRS